MTPAERDTPISAQAVATVLRGLLFAFAASQRADLGKIAAVLDASAQEADTDPLARALLADLAAGAGEMHRRLLGEGRH